MLYTRKHQLSSTYYKVFHIDKNISQPGVLIHPISTKVLNVASTSIVYVHERFNTNNKAWR